VRARFKKEVARHEHYAARGGLWGRGGGWWPVTSTVPASFYQSRLFLSGPDCLTRARAASIASCGSLLPRF